MTFSRLPYDFEEALAEVKSWRASYKPDYNTEAVLVEEMQRMANDEIIELAIQGHASTRDAICWALKQEREACAKEVENALYGQEGCGKAAQAIRARG